MAKFDMLCSRLRLKPSLQSLNRRRRNIKPSIDLASRSKMLKQQAGTAANLQYPVRLESANPFNSTSEPFLHLVLGNRGARIAAIPTYEARPLAWTIRLIVQILPVTSTGTVFTRVPWVANHIRHQPLVPGLVLARHHHRLTD